MNQKYKPNPQHNKPLDQKKMIIIIIIAAVTILLIVGATVFALFTISKNAKPIEPSLKPSESASALSSVDPSIVSPVTQPDETVAVSAPPLTEEPSDDVKMDEELEEQLADQGISAEEVTEQATSQIITVSSFGNSATIEFWEIRDNEWTKDDSMIVSGYVGEMGVTDDMSEYIKATPSGFFPVMDAFYIHSKPQTGLDTYQITEDTYWVDDPSSDFYNQHVEGTQYQDWNSAEHMIDYSSYEYGFVIGYNLGCVKGAGSAIFFHIGSGPTAGCVATSESYVLSYLSKLSSGANPYILIN